MNRNFLKSLSSPRFLDILDAFIVFASSIHDFLLLENFCLALTKNKINDTVFIRNECHIADKIGEWLVSFYVIMPIIETIVKLLQGEVY